MKSEQARFGTLEYDMWQHDISDTQRAAYFHCNPKAKSVTRSDLVAWLAEQSRKATKHPATKRAAARKAA